MMNKMMNTSHSRFQTHGSTLLVSLFTIVFLSGVLAMTLQGVSSRYWTSFQASSWQEALYAAEAGADIAMLEMRKSKSNDATAFSGWSVVKTDGSPSPTAPGIVGLLPDDKLSITTTYAGHAGEGNGTLTAKIVIDAPATLKASGVQWYRVRSTGIAALPGPPRVSPDKLDNLLRRLSLVTKPTGVTVPSATRTVECIAKPSSLFSQALMSEVQIRNDGSGLVVDSFDSADPNKSTDGNYDPAKRQSNGDIGSNAFPIKHDKTFDLNIKNDYVFGSVWNNYSNIKGVSPSYFDGVGDHPSSNTNSLIKTDGNAIPTGVVGTNTYRDLPRITAPNWHAPDRNLGTLDTKDPDQTVSSDPSAPTRVVASSVNLTKDTFIFKLPSGATDGYAEMWVQGDMHMKDGGMIQVEPGVHLTVYFQGDIKIEDSKMGAGFDVQSDKAADLVLLGVEQSDPSKKNADTYGTDIYTPYKATGNIVLKDADLIASLYAPDHNLVIDVAGAAKRLHTNQGNGRTRLQSGVDIYGSFVARTIHAKGPANFHFDEELATAGPMTDVAYVTWYEDVNLDRR